MFLNVLYSINKRLFLMLVVYSFSKKILSLLFFTLNSMV